MFCFSCMLCSSGTSMRRDARRAAVVHSAGGHPFLGNLRFLTLYFWVSELQGAQGITRCVENFKLASHLGCDLMCLLFAFFLGLLLQAQ